ncbi:unnamed protein product, partial [marine sediment metagenome]
VVAVIFGISGAWGLNALKNAKSEIGKLNASVITVKKDIDGAKLAIEKEKDKQVAEFKAIAQNEISDQLAMAKKKISDQLKSRVVEYNKITDSKITSLGKHANVKLPVKEGDIIYASYVASARNSEFYYRIIAIKDGIAIPLINRDQVVMATSIPGAKRHQWHSISASEVFEVHKNGDLKLAVELKKGGLTGEVEVFSPTLV